MPLSNLSPPRIIPSLVYSSKYNVYVVELCLCNIELRAIRHSSQTYLCSTFGQFIIKRTYIHVKEVQLKLMNGKIAKISSSSLRKIHRNRNRFILRIYNKGMLTSISVLHSVVGRNISRYPSLLQCKIVHCHFRIEGALVKYSKILIKLPTLDYM